MNVNYRRETDKSYMILSGTPIRDYQLRMLQENYVEGLLPVEIRRMNGEESFYYEITARQSIRHMYEKRGMNYRDIRTLLLSFKNCTEEMKRYLLDPTGLLPDPEYCFYHGENGRIEWVFWPEQRDEEIYVALAEFILEHMDYEDKMAVDTGYKFYKFAKEEHFRLERILTYMEDKYPEHSGCVSRLADAEEDTKVLAENAHLPQASARETVYAAFPGERDVSGTVKKKESPFAGSIEEWKRKADALLKGLGIGKAGDKRLFAEQKENGDEKESIPRNITDVQEVCPPTVLLSVAPVGECTRLRRMGKTETIDIPTVLPAIVGKDKERADIVISGSAVSRIHARIYRREGALCLQDLNSRNGTAKNGILLQTNETVELRPGDEIAFANLQYICE